MKPVARAVSSLLKSSSVWSPASRGLTDDAREGGGSEPVCHEILRSPAAERHASGLTSKSGADSWLILDNIDNIGYRMVKISYRCQGNVHELLIRHAKAIAQLANDIFICLHLCGQACQLSFPS